MRWKSDTGRARLILKDSSVLEGQSFGAERSSSGEVVFNTGMVGYPESMSDPSYYGQILVLTYPLVGNYGVPSREMEETLMKHLESQRIQVKGLVISDYSSEHSHWNSVSSLSDWMKDEGIPGICGIDTRALTKKLRSNGTMLGKIIKAGDIPFYDPNKENIVEKVSIDGPQVYGTGKTKVMVVDCGCKHGIIRNLLKRDVQVIRVPWDYDFTSMKYDGLLLSNGPGDPKMAKETIENVRMALNQEKPTFGICLGNQVLALAAGASTYKLKFGHRSQNQPCVETGTKRCYITSQNHGFAVNTKTLPKGWQPWFENANDLTNEGIIHKNKPFCSVQFHPEACPGPVDTEFLFDRFIQMIRQGR